MPDHADALDLATTALPTDTIGLLEGITTTRAIRRYRDEPIPDDALRTILFAATRAPSGSNRQPFRFIVLTDGPNARKAKSLIGEGARRMWSAKRRGEHYDTGSGAVADSPKARIARTMQQFVDTFESVPALVLACVVHRDAPTAPGTPAMGAGAESGAIYPACQNLLLAARALGYGGVLTGFHVVVDRQLQELLGLPAATSIAATITLGRPAGHHGPVRRRPLGDLVYAERWGDAPAWAVDPPGTAFASTPPPPSVLSGDGLKAIQDSFD